MGLTKKNNRLLLVIANGDKLVKSVQKLAINDLHIIRTKYVRHDQKLIKHFPALILKESDVEISMS